MTKKYTAEEKAQLLANLDLEVSHRAHQFEEWLADALENFRMHQEALISRVPRLVRDITLREFAKYNGDIQACLKGVQRERLGGEAEAIDKNTRKRKWVESQETEAKIADTSDAEPMKATKTARIMAATPSKKAGPSSMSGASQRARLPIMKTPATLRTTQRIPATAPSTSPHKPLAKPVPFPRLGSRPASPTKIPSTTSPSKPPRPLNGRVPSAPHFNPHIPASSSSSYPRWPRKDESMLSVNGSPLANPLKLGLDLNGWLSKVVETGSKEDTSGGHNRTNSIIVRTASSSQANAAGPSHTIHSTAHSRTNSASNLSGRSTHAFVPARNGTTSQPTQPSTPSPHTSPNLASLPLALAALVAVPTADGHLLEFDPFQTSPGEIDALDISDSAKQQAKDDMRRLVAQAMDRWKIT